MDRGRGRLIRRARKVAHRLLKDENPAWKLTQDELAREAGYGERMVRLAEAEGASVSDRCYRDLADALLRILDKWLPDDDRLRAELFPLLQQINDEPLQPAGTEIGPVRTAAPIARLLASLDSVCQLSFGLSLSETVIVLAFAIGAGLVSAAAWVSWFQGLGGRVEPHGMAALAWGAFVNGPQLVVAGVIGAHFRQEKAGDSILSAVLVGIGCALGALAFYDLPTSHGAGIRSIVMGWPYWARELPLVVAWSTMIAAAGFALQRVVAVAGRAITLPAIGSRIALVTLMTSVPVWICVFVLVGDDWEDARGLVAGLSLRMSLAMAFLYAPPSRRKTNEASV